MTAKVFHEKDGINTHMKILIVDDEKLERNGIRFLLNERQESFEILEASNGKEACEILKKNSVDILFTDIKMPFMNGIELVEQARKLQPDIEMVIFSGYGEFEYARQAIKFGVNNYVLKPVAPEEFHNTMDTLFQKIQTRQKKEQDTQSSQDYLEEYFLSKYLYQGTAEMLEKICNSISIDPWKEIKGMFLMESEDQFFETFDEEMENCVREELKKKVTFLNLGQDQELCLLHSKCDQFLCAEHLCNWMNSTYGERFYVAAGFPVKCIEDLPVVFKELDALMENKFYDKAKRLFLPESIPEPGEAEQFLNDMISRMITDVSRKDMLHLWEHFHTLESSSRTFIQYSQIYTKFMVSSLVKEICTAQYVDGKKLEEIIQKVYEMQSVAEVLSYVGELISGLEQRCSESKLSLHDEVDRAKSYIYEHYNEELSVEKLAELVYLSPGYFSYIFKKETGVNLSRFVRIYRIEKAKELLDKTNMKIVQICNETGFSNVSYFCKNFREYYGCSPEQFRKGEQPVEESL
ncbi:MAG: response regulator [Lachnospiraceae bacterium]|nr:response regulator [Lachnospiraceae bacterium]